MPATKRPFLIAGIVIAVLAALAAWTLLAREPAARHRVGLFTTLPILWNEAGGVGELLTSKDGPHWAKAALAEEGPISALDTLTPETLQGLDRIVLAQPRALSPDENFTLDNWVRGGGQVLLFADPMLTEDSRFALGDRRRPEGTVLLSPILGRWGLELQFDDDQPFGERSVAAQGTALPVNMPGRFVVLKPAPCRVDGRALVARCDVGKGRVLAVADADLLKRDDPDGAGQAALAALMTRAFTD
jgi:hypothetical protein